MTALDDKIRAIKERLAKEAAAKKAGQVEPAPVEPETKVEPAPVVNPEPVHVAEKPLTKAEQLAKVRAMVQARINSIKSGTPVPDVLSTDSSTPATDEPAPVKQDSPVVIRRTDTGAIEVKPKQLNKDQINYDSLNAEQRQAVEYAKDGESFCLIGPAGTGKTTTTRCVATTLYEWGMIRTISSGTKNIDMGAPSVVFVSFTNVAVKNIREALPDEFKNNCLTIHKLLEYHPEFYTELNEDGEEVKRVVYEPRYGINRQSLPNFTHCVIEESGSVPVWLYEELKAALPSDCTFIYLGDLSQLPPVFDDGILGFKLLEHKDRIVELKTIYRAALKSPITRLAHRILKGKGISDKELLTYAEQGEYGNLHVNRFSERLPVQLAIRKIGSYFKHLTLTGRFVCGEDVLLCPYVKQLGTVELNKYIGQARSELNDEPVYEVIAGRDYIKHYYSVGDHVIYAKQAWTITGIKPNPFYSGVPTVKATTNMDRWGQSRDGTPLLAGDNDAVHALLELSSDNFALEADKVVDSNGNQASHIFELTSDSEFVTTISQAGDVNSMYLSYALTVHKAQGSEWGRVFLLFHHTHATLINRELLYTAVTRARNELVLFYDGECDKKLNGSIFQAGVTRQKIKGNTLEAKLEYFQKKLRAIEVKQTLQARLNRDVDEEDMEDDEEE